VGWWGLFVLDFVIDLVFASHLLHVFLSDCVCVGMVGLFVLD